MKRKKAAIFVNNSLGELEWIGPSLQYLSNVCEVQLFIYRCDVDEYLAESNLGGISIHHLRRKKWYWFASTVDKLIDRVQLFLEPRIPNSKSLFFTVFYIKRLLSYLLSPALSEKFDILFIDYNFRISLPCSLIYRNSERVFGYPHGNSILHGDRTRGLRYIPSSLVEKLFDINGDSNYLASVFGEEKIEIVGSPQIFQFKSKELCYFDSKCKTILVLTRNLSRGYGIEGAEFLPRFDATLNRLRDDGYQLFVKHHPRDQLDSAIRNISDRYCDTVTLWAEVFGPFACCLHVFTSASQVVLAAGIPNYDIAVYSKDLAVNGIAQTLRWDDQAGFLYPEVEKGLTKLAPVPVTDKYAEWKMGLESTVLENLAAKQNKNFNSIHCGDPIEALVAAVKEV